MFERFSARSRQVVFAARFKAGERGANTIDVGDLLVGLILEDQGLLLTKQFLSSVFGEEGELLSEVPTHTKFFSSDVAQGLLADLNTNQIQSKPIPTTAELPLSTSLGKAFQSAQVLQVQGQHGEVEPLHLLAAILKEGESQEATLLQRYDITKTSVLLALNDKEQGRG